MACIDRTADFKDAVQASTSSSTVRKRRTTREQHTGIPGGKEYVAEAYKILSHINSLTVMLSSIRKPYLNVDSRRRYNAPSRPLDLTGDKQSWASIQSLSNEERDQIDLHARLILSRCADRVKEMETLEKRRHELLASKANTLTRWLPSRLRADESAVASDVTAAHRSSITWFLSRRLAEASQSQKSMQEERVKRELERSRTLGSGAARDALNMNTSPAVEREISGSSSWLGDASSSFLAATIGASPRSPRFDVALPVIETPTLTDDEDDDLELSASQILQFEEENASILRGVQDTLESVQQAESRLLDISALQMELVSHLTHQTELTDQLYDDAIATTASMEKGNVQLREAKRRAKDGRLYILTFLVGASLSLLFLHYY